MEKETFAVARRGRRPGPNSSRQVVLEAARARFASFGYARTTIRLVAADAGVDVAQVMQFFRSKDELFAAVMAIPTSALERFGALYDGPDDCLGERVVRAFLAAWEGIAEESAPLMATLRGAFVNDRARDQLRGFIQSRLLAGTRERVDPQAKLRAGLVASLLIGLVVGRRVIGVPLLATAEPDVLVKVVAPAIQKILSPQP
ncbi:TetR/AcrR family transcriptional regulator [Pseudomonas wadenswilerensis]